MFQKLCTGHILSEREAYALMIQNTLNHLFSINFGYVFN